MASGVPHTAGSPSTPTRMGTAPDSELSLVVTKTQRLTAERMIAAKNT
jgi:hypothetical protein